MAYQLDGTTQRLRVASPIVASYPFTLSAWIRTASTLPSSTVLTATALSGGNYYQIYINAGKPAAAGAVGATGATNLVANTTYHIAGVFTSSSIAVYLNGVLQASNANSAGFYSGLSRFTAGCLDRTTPSGFFNGIVSEFAAWGVDLSASEIASLGAGFSADQIRPQSLLIYASAINDLIDVRGGLAITNVNSATVTAHPRIIT